MSKIMTKKAKLSSILYIPLCPGGTIHTLVNLGILGSFKHTIDIFGGTRLQIHGNHKFWQLSYIVYHLKENTILIQNRNRV